MTPTAAAQPAVADPPAIRTHGPAAVRAPGRSRIADISRPAAVRLGIAGAAMPSADLGIFSFSGKMKILHLTWFAFFLTFVVWFNLAP
ncbi:hypothetical protein, partial [Poseidonocella sp. HB161398]|uniref:hypothetical protein n=1 Tax=Poseidonocella sp. HB161398 TaxID=2320855 RepID=UPI00110882E1